MDILAYFEDWSRQPGEVVRLAVSTRKESVRAVFERIASGPGSAAERKVETEERADILDTTFPGRWQDTVVGSHGVLPLSLPGKRATNAISVHCWIWPSLADSSKPQTVWSLDNGLHLTIEGGLLSVCLRDAILTQSAMRLVSKGWYAVAVVVDPSRAILDLRRVGGLFAEGHDRATGAGTVTPVPTCLTLAAAGLDAIGAPVRPYNGKIDEPTVVFRALDDAAIEGLRDGDILPDDRWNFGSDFGAETVAGIGATPRGRLFNGAERGVTGYRWNGRSDSFIETPDHYTAVQFHEDDMVDSNWRFDVQFHLPQGLPSGVYCVRLEAGGSVERCPLFVRGAPDEQADILLLMPTNTYLAYANEQLSKLDFSTVMAHEQKPHPDDIFLSEHPEYGRSCYDTHIDGTPCRYSSRRRPIIQMRPGFPNWLTGSYRHFPVDLYFVEWLEKRARNYHVATDEDLEREGGALLSRYKVVITGSHPEYWTRQGRDILESYLRDAGKLMYLGGNGFYWVTSRDPARPWVVEVRRDNSGTRCWDAPPGERGHVYTSEQGGIWKNRGLGPHRLAGIGFCAEGWSKGCGYQRRAESYEGVGAEIFRGVNEEIVGDFGFILGGAVGDEIDRYDPSLGSPEQAVVLASSTGVGREYIHVVEEQNVGLPDQGGDAQPDLVRSDMVYFDIEGGGAVFSVGSMTLASSMAWNGFDNNMVRVIDNALDMLIAKSG